MNEQEFEDGMQNLFLLQGVDLAIDEFVQAYASLLEEVTTSLGGVKTAEDLGTFRARNQRLKSIIMQQMVFVVELRAQAMCDEFEDLDIPAINAG